MPSTSSARNFARNGSTYVAKRGEIDVKVVNDAMKKYGIDPAKPSPLLS